MNKYLMMTFIFLIAKHDAHAIEFNFDETASKYKDYIKSSELNDFANEIKRLARFQNEKITISVSDNVATVASEKKKLVTAFVSIDKTKDVTTTIGASFNPFDFTKATVYQSSDWNDMQTVGAISQTILPNNLLLEASYNQAKSKKNNNDFGDLISNSESFSLKLEKGLPIGNASIGISNTRDKKELSDFDIEDELNFNYLSVGFENSYNISSVNVETKVNASFGLDLKRDSSAPLHGRVLNKWNTYSIETKVNAPNQIAATLGYAKASDGTPSIMKPNFGGPKRGSSIDSVESNDVFSYSLRKTLSPFNGVKPYIEINGANDENNRVSSFQIGMTTSNKYGNFGGSINKTIDTNLPNKNKTNIMFTYSKSF